MHKRFWIGLVFLIFGIGFLLHQLHIWYFPAILGQWWPLVLIIIGVIQLINRTNASWIPGFLLIIIGGLFLINGWFDFNIGAIIWPLVVIIIGLIIIFSREKSPKPTSTDRVINSFALFSGTEIYSQSQEFEGGSVIAIFGGSDIDLRDAVVTEKGATIDITVIFGGITIRVPENTRVELSGLPIFGGWENKLRKREHEGELSILNIKCLSIFGGVEVKD